MLIKNKLHIIIFILALLISLALLYQSEIINNNITNNINNNKNKITTVNIIIKNMDLAIHNEFGKHKAQLISNAVKHNPKENITYLNQPVLIITENDAKWHITAKQGIITHNQIKVRQIDHIALSGAVQITNNKAQIVNNSFIKLETEYLIYTPENDLITSDKPVTITSETSKTTAIGLKFNRQNQKLELLSNVKTEYINAKQN